MLVYVLFVVGFVLLIKGADVMVEGASSIGKRLNISSLVIGLTIVSFGTSLPELLVNLIASYNDSPDIGVGNVLGSNIANILLILGISAIISPLPITKNTYFIEVPFSLTATLLVGFLANASIFGRSTDFVISRNDGLVLLFFFFLFMGYVYIVSKQRKSEFSADEYKMMSVPRSVLMIVLGIVGLYFGGQWVVDGAIQIARFFNMSEHFIGLTVIAIGTSLPELVTSAMAAYKKDTDIAVGNVIGSNIFNLLWILGLSATFKPIPYDVISNSDIFMIIASSTALI
ncbi:MAG: calcium/sodium antiporter, partial [Cytophagales bacterium]|nr:calcium/sodium antiporter [Cytophagales bacterium]